MSSSAPERPESIVIGPLKITPDEHLARVDGHTLTLSLRELRLLTELARRAGASSIRI